MSRSRIRLVSLVRKLLGHYLLTHPEPPLDLAFHEAVAAIVSIVETNYGSQRVARFWSKERCGKHVTQTAYLERLIPVWIAEHARWAAIKQQEPVAWQTLERQLRRGARVALARLGHARLETAEDYSQRAAEQILKSKYTFDVPLDIWLATVLKNLILDRKARKDLLHYTTVSLDELVTNESVEASPRERQIADTRAREFERQCADRQQFEKYLARLSPLRAQVILGTYFQDLSRTQLAARLGKTPGIIYTLHHRALADLRKMLVQDSVSEMRAPTHQKKGKTFKHVAPARESSRKRAGERR